MTTASQMAPDVVVPKITLPSTDGKSAGNVENAAFRRQLPVALGRSHSQRTPRKDVIFSVRQGTMLEKQRFHVLGSSPATKKYHDESQSIEGQSAKAQKPSSTDRSRWLTTAESVAPAFTPPSDITPRTTWYKQADKVFRFYGYIVNNVRLATQQAPAPTRLVTIHFFPQDSTLEMMESKETSSPGLGRMFASRRPARVPLANIRVGSDVLINCTQVHIYDADEFTRRSIPELLPPERAPCPDKTFSVTPRLAHPQGYSCHQGSVAGNCTGDISEGASPCSWVASMSESLASTWPEDTSASGEDAPMVLKMYLRLDSNPELPIPRWDDSTCVRGDKRRRFILHYFLEDGTIQMKEISDVPDGYYFQGSAPIEIRRQRVLKEGKVQSMGVDHIGRGGSGPRSSRAKSGDRGIYGSGGPETLGIDGYLSPQDMLVGRTVMIMKRPMTVCGWDETSLAWWENVTGVNIRGVQGELDDFRHCVRPQWSRRRPENKLKSTFYEDPPRRPRTLLGRFLKASENHGKTLRFLAKATPDTETPSTKGNVFIIKFYPEDDTLTIFSSRNSGGAYKGVYLSRRVNIINSATGKPFKAGDFCIGFIARLPSLCLEVVDVDDFSRRYLTREGQSFLDPRWQTAPVWHKLLQAATAASPPPALGDYGGRNDYIPSSSHAKPPRKSVNFTIGDSYNESNGDALGGRVTDAHTNSSTYEDNEGVPDYSASSAPKDGAGTDVRAMERFARLWKECIGDGDTCFWFHAVRPRSYGECLGNDRTSSSRVEYGTFTGGGDTEDSSATTRTNFSPPHDRGGLNLYSQSSSPGCWSTPPWERLLEALSRRGIHVNQKLTAHERMLLERELADWWRSRGSGAELGHEQHQSIEEGFASPTIVPRSSRSPTKMTPVATENAGNDGDLAFNSACKKAKPSCSEGVAPAIGQAHYPSEVRLSASNEQDPSKMVSGAKGASEKEQGLELAGANSGTGEGPLTKMAMSERPLDMRAVALGVHEAPSTGKVDRIVRRALNKVWEGVFGRGGHTIVRKTLEDESKYLGSPADIWTMSRLLHVAAGLSRQETKALWLKFVPAICANAGDGGQATYADFFVSIKTFEACLQRGEMLGISNLGRNHADLAASMVEDCR